jgi:alkane 1-monooxygenase
MPPDTAAWLPLIFGFVLAPLLQVAIPGSLPVLKPNQRGANLWRLYLDSLLVASVPLQALMLIVSVDFWSSGQLDSLSSLAYLVGVGSFSGFCAINVGHELLHFHTVPAYRSKAHSGLLLLPPSRGAALSRFLASCLLSSVWFGTFFPAHLKIHHLYVGTPKDSYTARRGQSIYSFALKSLSSNLSRALRVEMEALQLQGKSLLQSAIFLPTILSIGLTIAFYLCWGGLGLAFFLGQAFVAIALLEWINYLQHYGIVRGFDSKGRAEPVRDWHAWNDSSWVMDIYLLNLFRHADHHMNPGKPYYLLSESSKAPSYPYPYIVMMLLSLVPPLFYSVAHKVLDSHPILSKSSKISL